MYRLGDNAGIKQVEWVEYFSLFYIKNLGKIDVQSPQVEWWNEFVEKCQVHPALDFGQKCANRVEFVQIWWSMCKKQRKCAKLCANLVEPGGAVLFILYSSLHLNSVYLSTRWSGGADFVEKSQVQSGTGYIGWYEDI